LRKITDLIEAGAIRPVVDKVFPFESINEALARVDSGRTRGKVVVTLSRPACAAEPSAATVSAR
jgi:alcohol dehydrogenase